MERYKRSSESLSAYVSAPVGQDEEKQGCRRESETRRVWRNEIECEFVDEYQARGLEEQEKQQEGEKLQK